MLQQYRLQQVNTQAELLQYEGAYRKGRLKDALNDLYFVAEPSMLDHLSCNAYMRLVGVYAIQRPSRR